MSKVGIFAGVVAVVVAAAMAIRLLDNKVRPLFRHLVLVTRRRPRQP